MNKKINTILTTIHDRILSCNIKNIDFEDILIGKLGLAQSCYQLYKVKNNNGYLTKVKDILENIFENIAKGTSLLINEPSLANGIPGLGLVLHQLIKENILDNSYSDQVTMITDNIYSKCLEVISKENFDYFYGATGLLFYLQEVDARNYVEHIVDIMHKHGKENNFLFYNRVDDVYSQGINFGFAHGSLAIVSVFLEIYKKGIQQEKTKELILKTTDSLLWFKKGAIDLKKVTIMHVGYDYPSIFPYNVIAKESNTINPVLHDNIFHFTDRLGWCNSDLSRMYVLYKLGINFNQEHYINAANEMVSDVVNRTALEDTAISDCYMCHGTSGVAHIFKKIHDLTGESIFYKTYEYWIKSTVDFMEKELLKEPSDKDLEILTGWLGPLFVLSAYNGKVYPDWDRIFLLN